MHAIFFIPVRVLSVCIINVNNLTAVFWVLFLGFPVTRVLICCLYNIVSILSATAVHDT